MGIWQETERQRRGPCRKGVAKVMQAKEAKEAKAAKAKTWTATTVERRGTMLIHSAK